MRRTWTATAIPTSSPRPRRRQDCLVRERRKSELHLPTLITANADSARRGVCSGRGRRRRHRCPFRSPLQRHRSPGTRTTATRISLSTPSPLRSTGVERVFAADMDGDGDTDVVAAATIEHNSPGTRTTATKTSRTHHHKRVPPISEGDCSRCGQRRRHGCHLAFQLVTVCSYENDGNQNFTFHTITTAADALYAVHAADMDGDGDTDILVERRHDRLVRERR